MRGKWKTLSAAAVAVSLMASTIAHAAGPVTVTVPGTAGHNDNPFAVNHSPAVGSGLALAGVTFLTITADGVQTPFAGYQNYPNGGAFVAEFVDGGGAPIVLPAGYPADRVCDTFPAHPCTLFWPVGHLPQGPSSAGTPGPHTSAILPVPAGAADLRYATLDSDYGDNGGAYVVTTTEASPTAEGCKKDGWRAYGVFKNQGDCVSFVATKGKNPPAGP